MSRGIYRLYIIDRAHIVDIQELISSPFRLLLVCGVLCCFIFIGTAAAGQDMSNDPTDLFEFSIEELMEVEVISASKKPESIYEAPSIMSVVSQDEIKVYGDRNLHQLLQRQASIYTRGSYMYPNNMASFRGDMPTHLDLHTLILFNGRPIRESGFGGLNFPVYMTFPLESLESVEIIRGPGSVLYGTNAFSGVIDLRSKAIPDKNEFSVSGMSGSYGYYETTASGGGRIGDYGFVGAIRTSGQNGYNYSLTDGVGVSGAMPDKQMNVSGNAHIENGDLTFDIFATSMESFHVGPIPFWSVPGHVFRVNKLFVNAGYKTDLNDKTRLELNLTYNLHENDFSGFPTGDVTLHSSDMLGEATLFYNPVENLDLVFGYLLEYQMNFEGSAYESIPLYQKQPQSLYFQGDYQLSDAVKFVGGTQWQRSAQGVEDLISRFGLNITPSENWGIKLMRGEAFRAPFSLETDVYDIPILVGNDDLTPETITTYDAQLYFKDEKTYAAATYFNSTIDRLIIRDTSVSPTSFINGGTQRIHGIELETKRFLTNNWHILGSFTYQEGGQSPDINKSVVPHTMLKVGTDYTWDWGSVGLFYSFFSKPPRLASETVVNPEPGALNLLSLNLRIDPSRWLDIPKGRSALTFRVENLFNEQIYVPDFNRSGNPNSLPDGPGMTFYGGFEVHF